jgi:hypothetical protein
MGSIPLFGLPHRLTFVRKVDVDDGFGGIIPGARTVLYEDLECRLSLLSPSDKAEMEFAGPNAANTFKCITRPAASLKMNDFAELAFGQFPNTVGVPGIGEGFPESFSLNGVVLNWDYDLGYYVDDPDDPVNTLEYDDEDEGWVFDGVAGTYTFVQDEDCNPFDVWDRWEDSPADPILLPIQIFRVLYVKQQITGSGTHHHTMLFLELEDTSGSNALPVVEDEESSDESI